MATFIRFHKFLVANHLRCCHDPDRGVYQLSRNGTLVYSVPERIAWRGFDDRVEAEIKCAMNLYELFG
jgi:hypothetical protein